LGEADTSAHTGEPVYALNLFDVADRDEYLAHSHRSAQEVTTRDRGRARRADRHGLTRVTPPS
jgi:hypothetical protein